jgi:hypothetical protein
LGQTTIDGDTPGTMAFAPFRGLTVIEMLSGDAPGCGPVSCIRRMPMGDHLTKASIQTFISQHGCENASALSVQAAMSLVLDLGEQRTMDVLRN